MDRKNKNRIGGLDDFLRYRKGEMTGEERNAFEKELQKDPFAAEAAEGFSMVSAGDAEKDMAYLKKQLNKKTKKSSFTVYYRVAAAIAVLVALSVIILNKSDKQEYTLSENKSELAKPANELPASEPVADKTEKSDVSPKPVTIARTESRSLPASPTKVKPFNKNIAVATDERKEVKEVTSAEEFPIDQVNDTDSEVQVKDINLASVQSEITSEQVETEKKMEVSKVAGVSAPMEAKGRSLLDYTPPGPVTGIDSFNIYLERNIHNPETGNEKDDFVTVSFTVRTDSTITDLKIIDSPGQNYSREAIRLIKEGPKWKPATINGKPVEEKYRVTIKF